MKAIDPEIAARIADLVAAAPNLFPVRSRLAPAAIRDARVEVAWAIYQLYPYPREIADAMGANQWTVWGWIKRAPKTRKARTRMPARHSAPFPPEAVSIPGEPMALEEVGRRLNGVTRERIRQIEERSFSRIRCRAERGDDVVVDLLDFLEGT